MTDSKDVRSYYCVSMSPSKTESEWFSSVLSNQTEKNKVQTGEKQCIRNYYNSTLVRKIRKWGISGRRDGHTNSYIKES